MLIKEETLEACERAIEHLTGEKLVRGDTGWIDVVKRALVMGNVYKLMWDEKHGEIQRIEALRDDSTDGDRSGEPA